MTNSKEQIIEYFKSGIKKTKDFRIGIEHENFFSTIKIIKELIIQK
jgi:glutamate--cysteine ligase